MLAALVGLAVLLTVIAVFLPREVTVERSTEIAATPETIFPLVNSMQRTQDWSPWLELDPDVEVTFSGPRAELATAWSGLPTSLASAAAARKSPKACLTAAS